MDKNMQKSVFLSKRAPYELTGEYLHSKAVTRQLHRVFDNGDRISECSARNANYFIRKQLRRTENLLQSKRNEATKKRQQLNEQWDDLTKKENELREMFIKYNQFILDSQDKTARALKRMSKQNELTAKRQLEIDDMTQKYEDKIKLKEDMNKRIIKFRLFEDFLNTVVESYPADFHEISNILDKYELLMHVKIKLVIYQFIELNLLDEVRWKFAKKLEQYAVQITGLNTRVSLLQQRHEAAQRQCRQWEELYERMRARATEQLVDVTFVKESCGRIYREICERKGVAPLYKDNYEKQLEVIKETLRDYKCINELAKRAEQEKLYISEKALVSQVTD